MSFSVYFAAIYKENQPEYINIILYSKMAGEREFQRRVLTWGGRTEVFNRTLAGGVSGSSASFGNSWIKTVLRRGRNCTCELTAIVWAV